MSENIPEIRVYHSDRLNMHEGIVWSKTYHLRTLNLLNFPNSSNRVNYRTVMNRAKVGIVTSSAKSLNILRQTLQNSINKDISLIIQKYVDTFFIPSIDNIKRNFGPGSVSEQHLQSVCRQILEEAKKMYIGPVINSSVNSPANAELEISDHENNQEKYHRKRHNEIDSDSESGSLNLVIPRMIKKKRIKNVPLVPKAKCGRPPGKTLSETVKREGPKWDPERLKVETKFVLGSKANKALGFGATRGRLYTKHADLFRYIGDQEDKQWLHERGLMPPAGGRAYLIIKEDIEDLLRSDEYRNAPGVNAADMGPGFTVTINMINKMKKIMEGMKNGDNGKSWSKKQLKPQNVNSNDNNDNLQSENVPETIEITPDDLEFLASNLNSTNPSPFNTVTGLSPNPENLSVTSDLSSSVNAYAFKNMESGTYSRLRNYDDDGYSNIQFQKPKPKTPWKSIMFAIFLGVAGSALITCSLINLWVGTVEEIRARSTALLVLGLIMFIPGIYHVSLAYLAYNQYPGYSFDDILDFN